MKTTGEKTAAKPGKVRPLAPLCWPFNTHEATPVHFKCRPFTPSVNATSHHFTEASGRALSGDLPIGGGGGPRGRVYGRELSRTTHLLKS